MKELKEELLITIIVTEVSCLSFQLIKQSLLGYNFKVAFGDEGSGFI